jgi:hypothetical protein
MRALEESSMRAFAVTAVISASLVRCVERLPPSV